MHFLTLHSENRRLWTDCVCICVNYANVCLHVLCMRRGWTGGLGDPRKGHACWAFDDDGIKYLECGTCCEQNIYRCVYTPTPYRHPHPSYLTQWCWHKCFSKVEKNNWWMEVAGLRKKNNNKKISLLTPDGDLFNMAFKQCKFIWKNITQAKIELKIHLQKRYSQKSVFLWFIMAAKMLSFSQTGAAASTQFSSAAPGAAVWFLTPPTLLLFLWV